MLIIFFSDSMCIFLLVVELEMMDAKNNLICDEPEEIPTNQKRFHLQKLINSMALPNPPWLCDDDAFYSSCLAVDSAEYTLK
ncbi:hypothetical protein HID58_093341 [Brassica napus]|uniref:Uncharacterized protein n=1 Tax=Brassica napus TaxID=3708 RepID=A0ABQ7XDS9_BRANA|nr:hypothetical protein HID58_093341 [Brassica napus]